MMFSLAFDLGTFFSNLTTKATEWGGYFIMFLGVILIIIAVWQIVKGFASHGRGQVNWLMTIGMLLVGGFLAGVGYNGVKSLADVGMQTISGLGG